jgi:hypothetical protein
MMLVTGATSAVGKAVIKELLAKRQQEASSEATLPLMAASRISPHHWSILLKMRTRGRRRSQGLRYVKGIATILWKR